MSRRFGLLLLLLTYAPACFFGSEDEPKDKDGPECLQSGIVGPSEADDCAALFLAALTCLGDPAGLQIAWDVLSPNHDISQLEPYLAGAGASVTIPAAALQPNAAYVFSVDLTAKDGRSEHFEHTVQVLPRGALQAAIAGDPVRNHFRSQTLTLAGSASGGDCSVSPTFEWEQIGPGFVDLGSTTTATADLFIGAYAMQVDQSYGFQLTARAGEASSSASVQIDVVPQPLDVQITGGDRTAGLGSLLVLDAGGARDPDLESGGEITYQWTVLDEHGDDTGVVLPSTPVVHFDPVLDAPLALDARGVGANGNVGFLDFRVNIVGGTKVGAATARVHFTCDLSASPVSIGSLPSTVDGSDSGGSFVVLAAEFSDVLTGATTTAWHDFSWRESQQQLDLSTRVAEGGLDQRSVKLNLFGVPEANYVFEVDATLCGDTESASVGTLVNAAPTGGTVSIDRTSATDSDDIVFTASGWSDANAPLTYRFSVRNGAQILVLNSTPTTSTQITARITTPGTFNPQVTVTDVLGASTVFQSTQQITVTSSVPPGIDEVLFTPKTTGFTTDLLTYTGESFNTLFETGYAGTASAATNVVLYTNPTPDQYRTVAVIADMDAGAAIGSIGVNYGTQPTTKSGCFAHVASGGKYGVTTRIEPGKSLVLRRYASSSGPLKGTFEVIVLYGNSSKFYLSTDGEPLQLYRNDSAGTCLKSYPLHFSYATPPPPSAPDPNPMQWRFEICPPAGDPTPCIHETHPLNGTSIYPNRNVAAGWSLVLRTINTDGAPHVAETTTAFTETTGLRFVELRAPLAD